MRTAPATAGISILGSTGSIGRSTLDVVGRDPGRLRVVALAARANVAKMLDQIQRYRPALAVMADAAAAEQLQGRVQELGLQGEVEIDGGSEAVTRVATHGEADLVMAAVVGAAGLLPTLAAARAGKRVLLANKEALVMSGSLFMAEVRNHGALLLPIDSEHNAVFQCLPQGGRQGLERSGVERIVLTASGGPFRRAPLEQLHDVTPEQACAHPNWVMGRKISVDSATMMNKGLEVIEACWLFGAQPAQVEVLIHPQSIVHSLVSYRDGSMLAQLGNPDMRTPIAHALAWPERMSSGVAPLDLAQVAELHFERPDFRRFPCLGLAYQAMEAGGTAPAVLNAANEVAVAAFLEGRLAYGHIPAVIENTLAGSENRAAESLDDVLRCDRLSRKRAGALVARLGAAA